MELKEAPVIKNCQGVQRPGKPGNVREFRCKGESQEKSGNFVV